MTTLTERPVTSRVTRPRPTSRTLRRRSFLEDSPWSPRELIRTAWALSLGAVGLGASWYAASGSVTFTTQLGWIVAGIASTAVACLGLLAWLFTGFRIVRAEQHAIMLELAPDGWFEAETIATPTVVDEAERVTADGMSHYHSRACTMARGKQLRAVTVEDIVTRELQPCKACQC